MPRLTDVRLALLEAVRPTIEAAHPGAKAEVATGPSKGPATFKDSVHQTVQMILRAYVGPPDDPKVQAALDGLLDPVSDSSIRKALLRRGPHDELIQAFQIVGTSGWRVWQAKDSPPVLGAEVTVEVTT